MKSHKQMAEQFGRSLAVQALSVEGGIAQSAAAAAIVAMSSVLTRDITKQHTLRRAAASEYKRSVDILAED